MRKVFLENLPHRGKLISWQDSIGCEVPFEYEEITGCLKIVDYDKQKKSITVEYLDKKKSVTTSKFINNGIAGILGVRYGERKHEHNIGDIVKGKRVVDIVHCDKETKYYYECLKCHSFGIQQPSSFKKYGCPVCCGYSRKIQPNVNGIKAKYPEIYGSIIDGDKDNYGQRSNHKVHWLCPSCNNVNHTQIAKLTESQDKGQALPCVCCKKSYSMAENIMFALLSQVVDSFEHHIKFNWSKNKEYDAHVGGVIIELHGAQHYSKNMFDTTYIEQQKNDARKKYLAEKYYDDLKGYIVIDCRESNFDFIKSNIINSRIDKLLDFDFADVDWEKIARSIKERLFEKVADLYNAGTHINTIAKELNVSKNTILAHLKFCDENKLIDREDRRNGWHIKKQVRCKNTGEIFGSIKEAAQWCGLNSSSSIGSCCNNYKGFESAGKHPDTLERLQWEYV